MISDHHDLTDPHKHLPGSPGVDVGPQDHHFSYIVRADRIECRYCGTEAGDMGTCAFRHRVMYHLKVSRFPLALMAITVPLTFYALTPTWVPIACAVVSLLPLFFETHEERA